MKPVNFSKYFVKVRQAMKIREDTPVDYKFSKKSSSLQWNDPLKQGIEVTADNADFSWSDKGLFYQGKRVLLYIRDQLAYYYKPGKSSYKYHVTWCRTLGRMHSQHKYEKYVVSTNTEGMFSIHLVDGEKVVKHVVEPLHVCKDCLKALNWHGYAYKTAEDREKIYQDFSLEEFFEEMNEDNSANFAYIPHDTDMTAPDNIYPAEWQVLSKMYREEHHWQCSKCGRIMSADERNLLHVHHRNGRKDDCSVSNLVVLCADCHQEEHKDHKIFGSTNYRYKSHRHKRKRF